MLEAIGDEAANLSVQGECYSPESVHLDLLNPDIAEEVLLNDVVRGGQRIKHSHIGQYATSIETFLVCSIWPLSSARKRDTPWAPKQNLP